MWYVIPWMVYVGGQATADCGVMIPALNSAVEVMTFIEEPGATAAVSAKSLKPSLLATARMSPVDGWMTTIELFLCMPTAARAAVSSAVVIVVVIDGTLSGATTIAWLFATTLPLVVSIWTSSPGLALPGRRGLLRSVEMLLSPASPKVVRPSPLASVTRPTVGAT